MNFLDPEKWSDLEALTKEFEELDEERVKQLHERLRPYFLRRVKSEVLDLPAKVCKVCFGITHTRLMVSKNEVIVPVSMAPLQKEIYKSILSKRVLVSAPFFYVLNRLNFSRQELGHFEYLERNRIHKTEQSGN